MSELQGDELISPRTRLGDLLERVRALRKAAEDLDREPADQWTQRSAARFSSLSQRVVSDILPNLAALESVLAPHLDSSSNDALATNHRKTRELAERCSLVSESTSRGSRTASAARMAHATLRALGELLGELLADGDAALSQLETRLSESDLEALGQALEAASRRARANIVLITQPEPAPTDAYVLRKRPDLTRAYAKSLLDLDETSPHTDQ